MAIRRFPSDVTPDQLRSLSADPPTEDVAAIVAQVRARGNAAVGEFEQRFSQSETAEVRRIESSELEQAPAMVDPALRSALELAIENVTELARRQLAEDSTHTLGQDQSVQVRQIPVDRVGVYVPGGRGAYPSTAIMGIATASVAGVEGIVVVSPTRPGGSIDPAVLAVCALLGVEEVYAIGGAQAIAALAIGTETIKPVDVIVGPGNTYVQEAKRQLVGAVAIDGIAGPSELVVVSDSVEDVEAISLDLLAQAEHGPDSLVALISPVPELLDAVAERCAEIDAEMAIVLCADLSAGVALADALAPEHMQIIAANGAEQELANQVRHAGCLFLGSNAATAFGDYVVGSNHVLPTGGAARHTGALSVATFTRRMSVVEIPDSAAVQLAGAGSTIARAEGFNLHAESIEIRKKQSQ